MKLPENLISIHKQEEEIRTKSEEYLIDNSVLSEHIEILFHSLDCIFVLINEYHHESEDELSIQGLGIRLFNDVLSSLKLALSGYYQSSLMMVRDIVESGFLLDYFTLDRTKIELWRTSTEEQRLKNFKAVKIREALDKRDGYKDKRRYVIYSQLSEYASHPSFHSLKLIAPSGLGMIGPYYEEKYLKAAVEELVRYFPYFTLIFISLFNHTEIGQRLYKVLDPLLSNWISKYLSKL